MTSQKFLEEFKVIEGKLRQKLGSEASTFSVGILLHKLEESRLVSKEAAQQLNELRLYRNRISSGKDVEQEIPAEIQQAMLSVNRMLNAS